MSIQDDIFDIQDTLKNAHKMKPKEFREMQKAFERILARLYAAERAEDELARMLNAFQGAARLLKRLLDE